MHTIRLRGPWVCDVVASGPTAASHDAPRNRKSSSTIRVPVNWMAVIDSHFRGAVMWQRSFRCPTGLSPHTRVILAVPDLPAGTTVKLNSQPLGTVGDHACGQFDIRRHLRPANQVEVRVPVTTDAVATALQQSQFGDIRLEIDECRDDD